MDNASSFKEKSLLSVDRRSRRDQDYLFDVATDLLVVGNFDGYFIQVNKAWETILGWTQEEITSAPWIDFVHPEDIEKTLAIGNEWAEGKALLTFKNRYRCKDGSYRWLSWKTQPVVELKRIYCAATDITERKQTEVALHESEKQFRTMADNAPAMLWVTDPNGNCNFLSKSWYEFTGQTNEESRGLGWTKAVHPDEQKKAADLFMEASLERKFFNLEYRLRRYDGTYRWAIDAGQPYFSETGEFLGFIGSVIDIHERKEVEEDLQQSEGRFRAAVQAVNGILWTNSAVGEMIGEQPGWAELTGQSFAEYQGFGWTDAVHPDDAKSTINAWNEAVAERKTFEHEHRVKRRDGVWRVFSIRAIPAIDEAGNITEWVGVHTDITEQRLSEEALRASHLQFRQMADSINQMIWVTQPDGYHEYYNKRWYEYTGVPEGSTDGEAWKGMLHPDDEERTLTRWKHSLQTGEPYEIEYRLRRADGVYRWALGRAECVRNKKGKIIKWYGTCTEIQELVEAKERAEAANISKSDFLANMSHEIRTPMNAVIGLSNILATSSPLTSRQNDFIRTLQLSANSLLGLINDLLDIAKIEAHSIELEHLRFSVVKIVQETISMMKMRASEKGLTFNVQQDCECIEQRMVLGDPTRVRQILLNLCSNAVKFTEKGGISVQISCVPIPNEPKEIVKISVIDSGIGIPSDKIGDIFQKFTQADSSMNRKYGGTGLGLAITKTLTEIMGGTIELESEMGVGSTFTVCIPLEITIDRNTHIADIIESNVVAPNTNCNSHILLVEDYAPNILVATTFLESFGYVVDVAVNGTEAVEKVKKNDYVAVLMDVQMHGMNGFDATQMIRADEKQTGKSRTHIIGMTAHALVGDRERCISAGMDDYISKPFNPDVLERMLSLIEPKASV